MTNVPPPALEEARALYRAGSLPEAAASYARILESDPGNCEALLQLATINYRRGRPAEALRLIERSLAIDPRQPHALMQRGIALAALARFEEALGDFDKAAALDPRHAAIQHLRGTALRDCGRHPEALGAIERAIALKPDFAEAYNSRGIVLVALKRPAEALASFERAAALEPRNAAFHNNRGIVLCDLRRHREALASFDRAIVLKPDYAEAHGNRGLALQALDRYEEALISHDRDIALRPRHAPSHGNRGTALRALGRHSEALSSYDAAIALDPEEADARFNKSTTKLMLGDFAEGWRLYECRWEIAEFAEEKRDFPRPRWAGEPVAGRTVLLHAEQGYGDTIQFCRYAPLVAARGAKVVLAVQPPLKSLLASLDGVAQVLGDDETLPDLDFHCPLLSLPLAFGTTLATIPSQVPYLAADPVAVANWRARIDALPGMRIGLVWAGNRLPDARRSIEFGLLSRLANIPGVSFVSLQKGAAASPRNSPASPLALYDWTEELDDFADTAALIAALDLVISVDTAVAHLAGALGRPVWLLNSANACWRWLLERDDSPWYPTLRQFRQPEPGDWDSVLAELRKALEGRSLQREPFR